MDKQPDPLSVEEQAPRYGEVFDKILGFRSEGRERKDSLGFRSEDRVRKNAAALTEWSRLVGAPKTSSSLPVRFWAVAAALKIAGASRNHPGRGDDRPQTGVPNQRALARR